MLNIYISSTVLGVDKKSQPFLFLLGGGGGGGGGGIERK